MFFTLRKTSSLPAGGRILLKVYLQARTIVARPPHELDRPLLRSRRTIVVFILLLSTLFAAGVKAFADDAALDDITAKYHFLSNDDTLAILDEEGRLKGYIEVSQPASESEEFLTFNIIEGSRDKDHVKFRSNRIHGRYYRFDGTVERGKGNADKDADYLHLTGILDIVTVDSMANKESVQSMRVTFKSIGKSERPDDN